MRNPRSISFFSLFLGGGGESLSSPCEIDYKARVYSVYDVVTAEVWSDVVHFSFGVFVYGGVDLQGGMHRPTVVCAALL